MIRKYGSGVVHVGPERVRLLLVVTHAVGVLVSVVVEALVLLLFLTLSMLILIMDDFDVLVRVGRL